MVSFLEQFGLTPKPSDLPVTMEEPKPELVAECWQESPPDAEKCMAAMRALCKGGVMPQGKGE
jgi:hypothetical protein